MTREVAAILIIGAIIAVLASYEVGGLIMIIGVFVLLWNLFVARRSDV